MKNYRVAALLAFAAALCTAAGVAHSQGTAPGKTGVAPGTAGSTQIERGRYMIVVAQCNVCHTAGYGPKQGKVPEGEWLLGNPVGFRVAAGTTYASNLRLSVQAYTEDQWVQYAKTATPRLPMPFWSLHAMKPEDLRAMYQYMKHLGPAGKPAPDFLPPDKEPNPPYEIRRVIQ